MPVKIPELLCVLVAVPANSAVKMFLASRLRPLSAGGSTEIKRFNDTKIICAVELPT